MPSPMWLSKVAPRLNILFHAQQEMKKQQITACGNGGLRTILLCHRVFDRAAVRLRGHKAILNFPHLYYTQDEFIKVQICPAQSTPSKCSMALTCMDGDPLYC